MGCLWSCESGDDPRYSSTRASAHNTGRRDRRGVVPGNRYEEEGEYGCERYVETTNDRYGFGTYRCPCCKHKWTSKKAWKDEKQGCLNCYNYCDKHKTTNCSQSSAYPSGWRPLTAEEMRPCDDRDKDHIQELCGMCKRLGYYCGDKHKNRRVKPSLSGPRFSTRKSSKFPSRPPSYNSAMRPKKFTPKRFGKY